MGNVFIPCLACLFFIAPSNQLTKVQSCWEGNISATSVQSFLKCKLILHLCLKIISCYWKTLKDYNAARIPSYPSILEHCEIKLKEFSTWVRMEKAEGFCAPSWCFTFEKHRGFSNIVSTPVLFCQITFTKGDVVNIEIIIYINYIIL